MTRLRFRPGTIDDRKALRALYKREHSPALPSPTNKDLETALRDGRFIVGETEEGEIVACATMIPFSPADSVTYVGELTGAFVDKRFRGGKPVSLQTLMLGLRILHHVALEGESVKPAATNTIITIVKKTNKASLANVKKAGFVECESQPDWLEYDKLSWHQGSDKDEWQCFRATSDTVQLLAEKLVDNGLLEGKLDIKTSSGGVEVELIGFRELKLAAADVREMASGQYRADLSDLPDELLY
jgi:hypothetical protein